jgi:hypothetical protein
MVYEKLSQIVGRENCALALVWQKGGISMPFKISSNSVSSSIYNFDREKPWNDIEMTSQISLITTTLDDLAISSNFGGIKKNFLLVLDIQGSELPALQGGREVLRSTTAIICEISKKSTYEGGTDYKALNAFLKANGFKKVGEWIDFGNGHGDALYVSQKLQVPLKVKINGKFTWFLNFFEFGIRVLSRKRVFRI